MRAMLAVLLVGYGSVTTLGFFRDAPAMRVRAGQSSAATAKGSIDRFLGTWKLIATETRDAKGQVIAPATPPPAGREGFITYAPSGYMGVVIMQGGRQKYAAQQPT